jgi:hypothetical protein
MVAKQDEFRVNLVTGRFLVAEEPGPAQAG